MTKSDLFWLPTKKLINMFAEYNPQQHSETEDLPKILDSLLFSGWFAVIGINLETKTIVGGHGRVMAANMAINYSQEWFDEKFENFLEGDELWASKADIYKERFTSEFWQECPCIGSSVDFHTEQATNIRLNSLEFDGRANKDKVAEILSKLPITQQQQASFDSIRAKAAVDIWKRKNNIKDEPEEKEPNFLNKDLTVYDDSGEVVDREHLESLNELPDNWEIETKEGERKSVTDFEFEEDEEEEPEVSEGGANVNADSKDRVMLIPLAIVLPISLKKKWDEWKKTELSGAKTDMNALIQGHPAFEADRLEREKK